MKPMSRTSILLSAKPLVDFLERQIGLLRNQVEQLLLVRLGSKRVWPAPGLASTLPVVHCLSQCTAAETATLTRRATTRRLSPPQPALPHARARHSSTPRHGFSRPPPLTEQPVCFGRPMEPLRLPTRIKLKALEVAPQCFRFRTVDPPCSLLYYPCLHANRIDA